MAHKRAVIMAGGKGTRLHPYTLDTPKPMLPINGQPMLEHIIERFEYMGFEEIWVAVNHQKNVIKGYFNDRVQYIEEPTEMGTAGALSLLKERDGVTVVINGDVLCNVNLNAVIDDHLSTKSIATICAYTHKVQIPYGEILANNESGLLGFTEKPTKTYLVNAGIYVLSEACFEYLNGSSDTMPETIQRAWMHDYRVNVFTMRNVFWLDVGTPEQYKRANELIK